MLRNSSNKQTLILLILGLALIVVSVVSFKVEMFTDTWRGFLNGVAIGILVVSIIGFAKNKKLEKK